MTASSTSLYRRRLNRDLGGSSGDSSVRHVPVSVEQTNGLGRRTGLESQAFKSRDRPFSSSWDDRGSHNSGLLTRDLIRREADDFWKKDDEDDFFGDFRHHSSNLARDPWNLPSSRMGRRASEITTEQQEMAFPRSHRPVSRQLSSPTTSLPRWVLPSTSDDLGLLSSDRRNYFDLDRYRPSAMATSSSLLGSKDSQTLRLNDDEDKFELTLDVQNYKPEELKISTQASDGTVVIEGRHKAASGTPSVSGNTSSTSSSSVDCQFRREYTLPASCRPMDVVSSLTRDGRLVITAPKRRRN